MDQREFRGLKSAAEYGIICGIESTKEELDYDNKEDNDEGYEEG